MTPHPFAILQRRHERPLPRPPPIRHHQPSRHLLILIVALFSSCLSRYISPSFALPSTFSRSIHRKGTQAAEYAGVHEAGGCEVAVGLGVKLCVRVRHRPR